jgi:hypothetical protein
MASQVKEYLSKARRFVGGVVTSWPALAAAAAAFLAFGGHLVFAPERLPPIGLLGPAQLGLPTTILADQSQLPDLGDVGVQVGAQARDAAAAARPYLENEVPTFFQQNPELARIANVIGFALASMAFFATLWIQIKRFRSRQAASAGAATA